MISNWSVRKLGNVLYSFNLKTETSYLQICFFFFHSEFLVGCRIIYSQTE